MLEARSEVSTRNMLLITYQLYYSIHKQMCEGKPYGWVETETDKAGKQNFPIPHPVLEERTYGLWRRSRCVA